MNDVYKAHFPQKGDVVTMAISINKTLSKYGLGETVCLLPLNKIPSSSSVDLLPSMIPYLNKTGRVLAVDTNNPFNSSRGFAYKLSVDNHQYWWPEEFIERKLSKMEFFMDDNDNS